MYRGGESKSPLAAWPRLSSMRRLLCSLRPLRRRSLAPPSLAWLQSSAALPPPDPPSRLVPTWSSFSSLVQGAFSAPFMRERDHCCRENLTGIWVWFFSRGIGKAIALELGKRYFCPNRLPRRDTQQKADQTLLRICFLVRHWFDRNYYF